MKSEYLLAFSILVLVLALPMASAAENVTDDIGISEDEEIVGDAVEGNTFADIQKAVDNASDNDVVELCGEYVSTGSAIEVNKNLVFDGGSQGATLDGNGASGIFRQSIGYTITLKNINFINAKNGAFHDDGYARSSLIITNCSFTNNAGKAIVCGGMCIVENSNFTNNPDGAIEAFKLSVDNCSFIGNAAEYGGAINAGREMIVKNSRFINNSAICGGAIFLSAMSEQSIINCLFDGNSAGKRGGSICAFEESSYLEDTYCYDDYEISICLEIFDSNITNSRAGESGGAIYCSMADLKLTNVKVTASDNCAEIYMDLGELQNVNSTYNTIFRLGVHDAVLSANKVTLDYGGYGELMVELFDCNLQKKVMFSQVKVKVWTGKKSKEYILNLISYDVPSGVLEIGKQFGVGKHKVEITSLGKYFNAKKLITYIIVKKAKTIVKAPKVKAKHGKSKKFKVTVISRWWEAPVSKLKIKIKVYTGKKCKTYTVKTNKKGVASINTKKLKRGSHKVKIVSANKNYSVSKKSKIIIK